MNSFEVTKKLALKIVLLLHPLHLLLKYVCFKVSAKAPCLGMGCVHQLFDRKERTAK